MWTRWKVSAAENCDIDERGRELEIIVLFQFPGSLGEHLLLNRSSVLLNAIHNYRSITLALMIEQVLEVVFEEARDNSRVNER